MYVCVYIVMCMYVYNIFDFIAVFCVGDQAKLNHLVLLNIARYPCLSTR